MNVDVPFSTTAFRARDVEIGLLACGSISACQPFWPDHEQTGSHSGPEVLLWEAALLDCGRVTGKPEVIHDEKPGGEMGLDSLRNQAI